VKYRRTNCLRHRNTFSKDCLLPVGDFSHPSAEPLNERTEHREPAVDKAPDSFTRIAVVPKFFTSPFDLLRKTVFWLMGGFHTLSAEAFVVCQGYRPPPDFDPSSLRSLLEQAEANDSGAGEPWFPLVGWKNVSEWLKRGVQRG
jgi:hypothetical protein